MEFGFDHVHFLVSDVRALTGYFERVFGMEAVEYIDDHKGAAYAIFRLGGGTLRIRGMREGDAPDARAPRLVEGLDHVGFAVEDVDAAVAWLASRGAEVLDAPPSGPASGAGRSHLSAGRATCASSCASGCVSAAGPVERKNHSPKGEPFSGGLLAGGALTIAGVWLVTVGRRAARAP